MEVRILPLGFTAIYSKWCDCTVLGSRKRVYSVTVMYLLLPVCILSQTFVFSPTSVPESLYFFSRSPGMERVQFRCYELCWARACLAHRPSLQNLTSNSSCLYWLTEIVWLYVTILSKSWMVWEKYVWTERNVVEVLELLDKTEITL